MNPYAIALILHLLSAVVWVGGMFFAYMALRPVAASLLETPVRLALWAQVFSKFFPWVWGAVTLLLGTGLWMMLGMERSGPHVHTMFGLGVLMMLLFMHVFFASYRRLKQAVEAKDYEAGGKKLASIRRLIGVNLVIGLIVVVVATGRYWQ